MTSTPDEVRDVPVDIADPLNRLESELSRVDEISELVGPASNLLRSVERLKSPPDGVCDRVDVILDGVDIPEVVKRPAALSDVESCALPCAHCQSSPSGV